MKILDSTLRKLKTSPVTNWITVSIKILRLLTNAYSLGYKKATVPSKFNDTTACIRKALSSELISEPKGNHI